MGEEVHAHHRPLRSATVLAFGAGWLAVAVALGAAGVTESLRPPVPQVVLVGLTAALIVAGVALPRLRLWALGLDVRAVVALHLTRLVAGAYFLVLEAR